MSVFSIVSILGIYIVPVIQVSRLTRGKTVDDLHYVLATGHDVIFKQFGCFWIVPGRRIHTGRLIPSTVTELVTGTSVLYIFYSAHYVVVVNVGQRAGITIGNKQWNFIQY